MSDTSNPVVIGTTPDASAPVVVPVDLPAVAVADTDVVAAVPTITAIEEGAKSLLTQFEQGIEHAFEYLLRVTGFEPPAHVVAECKAAAADYDGD